MPPFAARLYDANMPQCHIDGWRLPTQQALEQHLDTIFQENKRLRDTKAGASQQWYVNREDWMREFTDPAERTQTAATFFGMEAKKPDDSEPPPVSRVLADKPSPLSNLFCSHTNGRVSTSR